MGRPKHLSEETRRVGILDPVPGIETIMCPACHSEAFYRYGRTRQGKQRFLCLLCGRQFTVDRKRIEVHDRPACPACGSPMHAYKREHDGIRFRCSEYPLCRTFLKTKNGSGHELLRP